MSKNIIIAALGCALCLAIGLYAYHWYHPATPAPLQQWGDAKPIPGTEKAKTVVKPMKQIQTLDKQEVGPALKLPESLTNDPETEVIATGRAPAYEGNTNIVATVNTRTGEGSIQLKQEPVPFFGFPNEREVGIAGYYSADLQGVKPVGAVDAAWTPVRIGNIRIQVRGEINSRPEGRAGVRAFLRF